MSDPIIETTSRSWLSRVFGAFGRIVIGVILVIAACVALFWNEGRAVKTERALTEGSGIVVSVDAGTVSAQNNDKLVHISGPVRVADAPKDPIFADLTLPNNTIRIERSVEMYQWKETSRSETRTKLGGGTETVTTTSYEKTWSARPINSSSFKQPAGHENPDFAVKPESATSQKASIGAFEFNGGTLAGLGSGESLPVDEQQVTNLQAFLGQHYPVQSSAGLIYVGANPASPSIGDMRISLAATVMGDASVIGMQSGDTVAQYTASNGNRIFLTARGNVPAEAMFDSAQAANTTMTWVIRGLGMLAVFIGFRMIFSIIGVLGDVIPFIGDIFRFATGLVSLALTFVLAPLVIGIAWITYRPLVGLIILAIGIGLGIVFFILGKSSAAKTRNRMASQSS